MRLLGCYIGYCKRPPTLAARLSAQLLSGQRARRADEVAERLLAIQGQDPRGARLAVRARSEGVTAADVDRALTEERSLVITWLNRGTLHLVRSEDYPLLHALTTPQLVTQSRRRLAQEGVPPGDAERAIAEVERALAGRRAAHPRRRCARGSTPSGCAPSARRSCTSCSRPRSRA